MQEVKFSHSYKVISGGRAQKFNCSQAYLTSLSQLSPSALWSFTLQPLACSWVWVFSLISGSTQRKPLSSPAIICRPYFFSGMPIWSKCCTESEAKFWTLTLTRGDKADRQAALQSYGQGGKGRERGENLWTRRQWEIGRKAVLYHMLFHMQ